MEQKHVTTHEKGTVTSTVWQCDDIKLGHAVSTFREYTSAAAGNNNDVVRMHFGMRGNYSFEYKQLNRTFHLLGGHHNIMYSQGFDMVVSNHTLELEIFGIQYPKELFLQFTTNASDQLKRFAESIVNGKNVMLSKQWGAIDFPIQQAIQQIIYCNYAGEIQKQFLLSKSIELLVLCADGCNTAANKTNTFIKTKADKEKIIAVRDLINEQVASPPNLSEIARIVGINEYKLKRGFKETFNNTVFGYLAEQRLFLARQYLYDTQKTAAEIALDLGFATPQHFNNAFKSKFGVTPTMIRNNP